MWMRLASKGDVGHLRGVDQALYRRHTQNMSSTYDPLRQFELARTTFDAILQQGESDLPNAERLAPLVHRKLAWEALFAANRGLDRGVLSDGAVDALVAFALACWPEARSMPVYRALEVRRFMGPRAVQWLRPLVPPERGMRFLAEAGDRYDSVWEAIEAVILPGRRSVRFA
jgi:hypothetical protein